MALVALLLACSAAGAKMQRRSGHLGYIALNDEPVQEETTVGAPVVAAAAAGNNDIASSAPAPHTTVRDN